MSKETEETIAYIESFETNILPPYFFLISVVISSLLFFCHVLDKPKKNNF
jgi:hypothetical protein